MKLINTEIPGLVILEPKAHGDDRGFFMENFKKITFDKLVSPIEFVQDNLSASTFGVLRGLHYQTPPMAQSKLVFVTQGKVLDVAIDIRKNSPTFKKYVSVELSADNKRQLFIPQGFAHGFLVLSEKVVFQYKVDNYYSPEHDRGIRWDDPEIGIQWPIEASQISISPKDAKLPLFQDARDLF